MAFDESTMSRTQAQLWYNRFKEGRDDVNDDTRATDKNIAAKKMILNNRRIIEVADDIDISFGSCQAIFTNVSDKKRAKF